MKKKIVHMLELQNSMNSKVNDNWRAAGYEWYRAIWMEASEMLEHYGWKWWKQQSPDIMQVKLEVVDIVHFALSIRLIEGSSIDEVADTIVADFNKPVASENIRTTIELLAQETLATRGAHFSLIAGVMDFLEMEFEELYQVYVGKNVLNMFRQDNGYKEGTYQKIWNGREDNECLADILKNLDSNSLSFQDDIYMALDESYAT